MCQFATLWPEPEWQETQERVQKKSEKTQLWTERMAGQAHLHSWVSANDCYLLHGGDWQVKSWALWAVLPEHQRKQETLGGKGIVKRLGKKRPSIFHRIYSLEMNYRKLRQTSKQNKKRIPNSPQVFKAEVLQVAFIPGNQPQKWM